MDKFSFFMGFYGLLLGLAVAELLGGFGTIVRERQTQKLGVMTPLVGMILLFELVASFIDAFYKLADVEITLPSLALPTLLGLVYFFTATIIVPRDLANWSSLDDYFNERQRWIAGFLLLADTLVELMVIQHLNRTITGGPQGVVWKVAAGYAWVAGGYLILFFARGRRLQIFGAVMVLTFFLYIYGVKQVLALHHLPN